MDNVSHTLAGLAIGELIERSLPPEADPGKAQVRRRMLLVTGAVAANLPDLDLLLTGLLPAPLGYLLHHRGHTHTLLFALLQALALIACVWLWPAARRMLSASAPARLGLVAAALVGMASHLLLDYLNSYGLHPFYPFDNRWLYGDMIFIVEPVFWFALGAPLIAMLGRRWLRLALTALMPLFLVWAVSRNYLHWASAAALAVLAAGLLRMQAQAPLRSRRAVGAGIGLAVLFVGVQGWASVHGRTVVAGALRQIDPQARLVDAAMTPFPANPLCWNFASVELTGANYRLRRGMLSIAPAWIAQADCPAGLNMTLTSSTPAVGLGWEATTPVARLREEARSCHFAAWLRFARMPHLEQETAIDARFSNRGGNFTTFDLAAHAGQPCPAHVPPWTSPRKDLLGGPGG